MDLSKYKSLFISESREHLEEMTNNLLALERNPSDIDSINDIFRHAHSIKGMAASMGYDPIQVLSHTLEDAMDVYRSGAAKMDTEAVDELLAARDSINAMVAEVEKDEAPSFPNGNSATDRLKKWREAKLPKLERPAPFSANRNGAKPKPAVGADDFDGEVVSVRDVSQAKGMIPDWPDDKPKTEAPAVKSKWTIKISFEGESEAPAARAFLALKRIESLGGMTSKPSIAEIKAGRFEGVLDVTLTSENIFDKIQDTMDALSGVASYSIEPFDQPAERTAGQGSVTSELAQPTQELPRTIRVETKALDKFVNLVGELLTLKSGLRDIARPLSNPDLNVNLDKLEFLIHELHGQVMDVRMMPLETITSRFPRAVRDLGKQAGKEVELVLSGQDIEIDRAILERLNDPLVHIFRNSVDHGVENPQERERLRKPRVGKIAFDARREKDMIVLEISDDGKGIDVAVLKESAIAKGLIKAEDAAKLSNEDALLLVCIPGFSTSETISFISGRGVGMDVVKSTIESIGGNLRIASKLGQGTTISMYMPRTISILDVLLVKVGGLLFAVPIGKLLKTVEMPEENIKDSQQGKILLSGADSYPLFDLHDLLRIKSKPGNGNGRQKLVSALIIDHGNKPFAVTVEDFLGQEEAFIRPLVPPLSRIDGLAGIMTRGDGKPVFVLDVPNLRSGSVQ